MSRFDFFTLHSNISHESSAKFMVRLLFNDLYLIGDAHEYMVVKEILGLNWFSNLETDFLFW